MSAYSFALANARLDALEHLTTAMETTEDPAEKRRCAIAIFNAPDPCEFDDEIELDDDDGDDDGDDNDGDESGGDDEGGDDSEDDVPEDDNADEDTQPTQLSNPARPNSTTPTLNPVPDPVPPSIATLDVGRCDAAPSPSDINHTPYSRPIPSVLSVPSPRPSLPTPFLPAPTTPASKLIAIAGTTTPRPSD